MTVAAMLACALTLLLGRWQLSRAAYKEDLQARIESQQRMPPWSNSELLVAADPALGMHRPAVLRGYWLPAHTVFLDNRPMQARVGFYVVTPFALAGSGRVILVQRGWLPRNFAQRTDLPEVPNTAGEVTLQGRIAPSPGKLYELGQASHSAIRQNLEITAFAQETGLPLLPVTLLQTDAPSEGLLREWPAVDAGVQKHYGYAAQWFGIAALIALLYLWFQWLQPYFLRKKSPHHV